MIRFTLTRTRFVRLAPAFLLPALAACAQPGGVHSASGANSGPVTVGIVAINDFHGALEPPKAAVTASDGKGGTVAVPAGGAAWLASAVDTVRGKYTYSLTVSAGDMIGATQLSSALFLDEPAIGVMNRISVDYNAIGNHEFDRGVDELLRKQNGGCQQLTTLKPCRLEKFGGAKFTYLGANAVKPDGTTLFPATAIRTFGSGKRQVKVGIIGLTLEATADLSSREGLKGIRFADEADTINGQVPYLKAQGADAIVVLIHQGGYTKGEPGPDGCANLTGEIGPILDRLDPRVDVVVSGHTHWAYVCNYARYNPAKPILLTSAGVQGLMVTDITLEIDPATDRVVAKRAHNVIVQSGGYTGRNGPVEPTAIYPQFAPRKDVQDYVGSYVDASKLEIQRPVGKLAGEVRRPGGDSSGDGGSLGNLITDAQLAATRNAGAQIALMNPFGIRAPHSIVPAADGSVTFGQIYAVQPFTNNLVTQTLTGAQLKEVLEQGLDDNQPKQRLSVSAGFAYSYDMTRPAGSRIVTMTLDGKPIDPAADYRVTTNSFLANGGDSFAGLARQRDAVIAPMTDVEALEAWLSTGGMRAVPGETRSSEAKR